MENRPARVVVPPEVFREKLAAKKELGTVIRIKEWLTRPPVVVYDLATLRKSTQRSSGRTTRGS